MLVPWEDMNAVETIEEIKEAFEYMDNKKMMVSTLAILINEHDIDLREIKITQNQIAELSGDPLDFLDEFSGEIVVDED